MPQSNQVSNNRVSASAPGVGNRSHTAGCVRHIVGFVCGCLFECFLVSGKGGVETSCPIHGGGVLIKQLGKETHLAQIYKLYLSLF